MLIYLSWPELTEVTYYGKEQICLSRLPIVWIYANTLFLIVLATLVCAVYAFCSFTILPLSLYRSGRVPAPVSTRDTLKDHPDIWNCREDQGLLIFITYNGYYREFKMLLKKGMKHEYNVYTKKSNLIFLYKKDVVIVVVAFLS